MSRKFLGWPTLIECNQIWFNFQHCLLCGPHTSSIGVAEKTGLLTFYRVTNLEKVWIQTSCRPEMGWALSWVGIAWHSIRVVPLFFNIVPFMVHTLISVAVLISLWSKSWYILIQFYFGVERCCTSIFIDSFNAVKFGSKCLIMFW